MLPLKILSFLFLVTLLYSQTPYPDSVVYVEYGQGSGFGQEYFPHNILGFPSSQATPMAPANLESDLLSLGTGGSITLQFIDNEIYNGPGADFTVFENVFFVGGDTNNPFIETAFVEVSINGIEWQRFPYDTLTGNGLAGLQPTNGNADPTNPQVSGGDHFDLDSLAGPPGVIRFVRLIDTDTHFKDDGPGFDLDAVVGIHSRAVTPIQNYMRSNFFNKFVIFNYPNPFNSKTTISLKSPKQTLADIQIYNSIGQIVLKHNSHLLFEGVTLIRLHIPSSLASGVYYIRVSDSEGIILGNHKFLYLP